MTHFPKKPRATRGQNRKGRQCGVRFRVRRGPRAEEVFVRKVDPFCR